MMIGYCIVDSVQLATVWRTTKLGHYHHLWDQLRPESDILVNKRDATDL